MAKLRHRLDPWPAIADLFAGLLILTFGAIMLVSGLSESPEIVEPKNESGRPNSATKPLDPIDEEARKIRDAVLDGLKELGGVQRPCGDDICLDVAIEFKPNKDIVTEEFRSKIAAACLATRSALMDHDRVRAMEIFVEGHTDKSQAENLSGRDKELYNWNLSAMRATSVLYEFRQSCGIKPPQYRILATGYADTDPVCEDETKHCFDRNRRTRFRLRPDRVFIKEKILGKKASE